MAARALQKDIEARHGPADLPATWYGKPGRRAKAVRITPDTI